MTLNYAMKAVDELLTAVDQLAANVLPGTARPFVGHVTDEKKQEQARERQLEQDERDRRQAAARGPFALVDPVGKGETQDPYRLDIADLLVKILATADTIADRVSQSAGVDPQPHAASSYENPRRFLVHIKAWLDMAAESDPGLTDRIGYDFEALTLQANVLLGHLADGHYLPHDCPWCSKDNLRIRSIEVTYTDKGNAFRPHIVCEAPLCTVSADQVTLWHKGRPAWDLINEGEWFSRCIEAVDQGRRCRCSNPLPLTGRGGRPAGYCSSDCRREANAARMRSARVA